MSRLIMVKLSFLLVLVAFYVVESASLTRDAGHAGTSGALQNSEGDEQLKGGYVGGYADRVNLEDRTTQRPLLSPDSVGSPLRLEVGGTVIQTTGMNGSFMLGYGGYGYGK